MIAKLVELTKVKLTRRRFTAIDYLRMVKAELFAEGDRVELIQGEIIEMSLIYIPHISTLYRLFWRLTNTLGQQAIISV